jgi:GT2 family glycosyltransferase
MRASPSEVTVVTVAANSGEALLRWRDAWSACGSPMIIADNNSSDGFPEKAGIPVVSTGGNLGFGPAVNLAVGRCETPLVLITNPDTLPERPDSLSLLLRRHAAGTLSGAALLNRNGTRGPSGGVWPTTPWVAAQVLFPARSLWRGPNKVKWLQGALILVETRLFLENLGGFHQDFPLYFEDVDLCARALAAGVETRFLPEAGFIHREGTGAPSARDTRIVCFHWGMWKWFAFHRPGSAALVRTLLRAKCLVRLLALPGGSGAGNGYSAAAESLRTGVPPALPAL